MFLQGGQETAEQKPNAVSVQGHPVPQQQDGEAVAAQAEQANAGHEEAAVDDAEYFEDPTPPQPLEGRLAGLEPLVGYPQMTLADAVAAGNAFEIHKNKQILKSDSRR